MAEVIETIVLAVLLLVIWTPVIAFLVSDGLRAYRDWRDCRRLARRLRADAAAYRDLDLSRPRLGIDPTDRRRS